MADEIAITRPKRTLKKAAIVASWIFSGRPKVVVYLYAAPDFPARTK